MLIADTSFIVAVINNKDRFAPEAGDFYLFTQEEIIYPAVALTEVALVLESAGGKQRVVEGLQKLQGSRIKSTDLIEDDYRRVLAILRKYADSRIDFVDACIMALAERLAVTRILTYDRRDFGLFRPAHVPAFDLLP